MPDAKDDGKVTAANPIDPTANVLQLVAEAIKRQDDLRTMDRVWRDRLDLQTEKWRDKLDAERIRADGMALKAEANRLDALLLANTSNVALALGKQEGQAQAQDRRIAVLEQNQYQAGGKDIQRVEIAADLAMVGGATDRRGWRAGTGTDRAPPLGRDLMLARSGPEDPPEPDLGDDDDDEDED